MKKVLPKFCLDYSFNGCKATSSKHKKTDPHNKECNLQFLLQRARSPDYTTAASILTLLKRKQDGLSHYDKCSNANKSKIDQYHAMLLADNSENIKDLKKAQTFFQTSIRLDKGNPMTRYRYAQLLQDELDNTGPFAVIEKKMKNNANKKSKNSNKSKNNTNDSPIEHTVSDARKKQIMIALDKCYREAIKFDSKLTLEQKSDLHFDFAKFQCADGREDEALAYFEEVEWNESNYTTRKGFDDLKHYIKALFICNEFQECVQILEKVDRGNLKQDDKNFVVQILGVSEKFVEANDEIGDLFDCKKSGKLDTKNNKFFKYWLEDEDINILSLLRFMKLFSVDKKLLPQFINDTISNMISSNSKQNQSTHRIKRENSGSNSNSNSNSNGNSNQNEDEEEEEEQDLDINIDLKRKECVDLLKQLVIICNAFGVTNNELNSDCAVNGVLLSPIDNMNSEDAAGKNTITQKRMKEAQLFDSHFKKANHFKSEIETIEQARVETMHYKVENYLDIMCRLKNNEKETQSKDWQKTVSQITNKLFNVKVCLI